MTKTCTKCGTTRPVEEFYRKARSKDGRASSCKPCANEAVKNWESRNPKSMRERTYRWRSKYPEKQRVIQRRSAMKLKYGITPEQYDALLAAQAGGCGVCGTKEPTWRGRQANFRIDHDHGCCPGEKTCGKCIRGLLCGNCNTMLGMAKDNPDTLRHALIYLEVTPWSVIAAENTDMS